jgi:hypothetical protein
MIRPEHQFDIRPDLRKAASTKAESTTAESVIRPKQLVRIRAPGRHIQITIMIDTQQQYIKLNIRGEISIIVMNKFFRTILRLIRRVHQFERRD